MPSTMTRPLSKAMPYAITEFNRGRRSTAGPTARPGMGAIPHESGVAFRVWAPHAQAVSVIGTFNSWDKSKHLLARENPEGYWYADVPDAKIGHEYRYLLKTPCVVLSMILTYALDF
jgi:1,4-alpha-glucan branching enzyme